MYGNIIGKLNNKAKYLIIYLLNRVLNNEVREIAVYFSNQRVATVK